MPAIPHSATLAAAQTTSASIAIFAFHRVPLMPRARRETPITRGVNLFAARLANATVLPLDPSRLAIDARKHIESLTARAKELKFDVDVNDLSMAVDQFDFAARQASALAIAALQQPQASTPGAATVDWYRVNAMIRKASGGPLDDRGLPQRPWFINLYAANDPDSGYAAWMLPGVRWAIERRDAEALPACLGDLISALRSNTEDLQRAIRQLQPQEQGR